MSKTFAVMKTDVGNMIQDTSGSMATLIGTWLNDKYRDIAARHQWSALIDFTETITTVAGTAQYNFPTSFEEELFVANITTGKKLTRYDEGRWWKERYPAYLGGTIERGEPQRYIVGFSDSKIRLDPTPDAVYTIAIPYKASITELTGSAAVVIPDIETAMEYGATHEALIYLKQYQKADYFLQKYEMEVAKRIGKEKARYNQLNQFQSDIYRVATPGRLLGEGSYDTI